MKYKKSDRVLFKIYVGTQVIVVKGFIINPWHTTAVKGDHYVVDSLPNSNTWLKNPIVVSERNIMPMPKFKPAKKSFRELMNELKVI